MQIILLVCGSFYRSWESAVNILPESSYPLERKRHNDSLIPLKYYLCKILKRHKQCSMKLQDLIEHGNRFLCWIYPNSNYPSSISFILESPDKITVFGMLMKAFLNALIILCIRAAQGTQILIYVDALLSVLLCCLKLIARNVVVEYAKQCGVHVCSLQPSWAFPANSKSARPNCDPIEVIGEQYDINWALQLNHYAGRMSLTSVESMM